MTTILFASPRKKGNTAALMEAFTHKFRFEGQEVTVFVLYEMDIVGCRACLACQDVFDAFACPIQDDMQEIFDSIRMSDLILLASPIYSWYVTAPLKAALDRLVYGMNKILWQGKRTRPR